MGKYIVIIVILCLIACIIIESMDISTTIYKIKADKLTNKFIGKRIVQLSDLHCKSFGKNNEKIIKLVDRLDPNVVFLTGDMIDGDNKNYESTLHLLKYLSNNYKVYYITGNHEHKALVKKYRKEYMAYFREVKSLDIKRLNNQKVVVDSNFNVIKTETIKPIDINADISIFDNKFDKNGKAKKYNYINLYSLILPFNTYRYLLSNRDAKQVDFDYIRHKLGDLNTNEFNILLSHNPLYFKDYVKWSPDLVFSGHVHGGIIRIPKIGGLLSPDRTFFPKYCAGKYTEENTTMFVSRGLGGSAIRVRINNKPEIVVVDFE